VAFDEKSDPMSDAWQIAFLSAEYGCDARDLPAALRQLGTTWELGIEGLERPIAPVVYGYMDMVLHYPGGQAERRRRGGYPFDWNEVDFNALFDRKLQLLQKFPDPSAIRKKLDELEATYAAAQPVFAGLVKRATLHRQEAELYSCFADLKLWYTRAIRHLVYGGGDLAAIQRAIVPLRERTKKALAPFYEKPSVERLDHVIMEPMITALTRL